MCLQKNQQDLLACTTVPKGWYMFIAEDDPDKIGTPSFQDSYFCNNPAETCCYTRSQKQAIHKLMTAMQMIDQYGKLHKIDIDTNLVHRLKKGEKKIHACIIGPLDTISHDKVKKFEHYVRTRIPGIGKQNIYYQGKLQFDTNNNGLFLVDDVQDEEIE